MPYAIMDWGSSLVTPFLIELRQVNKEHQNILNIAENFLEQLCSGNGQQKLYTATTNTYKRKKTDVDLTGESNNKYYVYVKLGVSSNKPF